MAFVPACGGTTTFGLTNDTKERIDRAVVEVNDRKVELSQIEPGGRATGTLGIGGDDEYHIIVRFQSGRLLEKRLGYVTSGVDIRAEFSVTDMDISLKSAKFN